MDTATLDRFVREMQGELYQVKNATQHLCTMASQIAQGLSHIHIHPTLVHRDGPLSGPSSSGQPDLEHIDTDKPMHDEENYRR